MNDDEEENLLGNIASEDDDSEDSNEYSEEDEDDEDGDEEEDEESDDENASNESDDSADSGSDEVSESEIVEGSSAKISDTGDSAGPSTGKADLDEYESGDTSDEEVCNINPSSYFLNFKFCFYQDLRNTIGKVPMHWYDEYPILGYDWDGKPILKPERRDELDNFLKRMEDPNFWYFYLSKVANVYTNEVKSQEDYQGSQHRTRCSFE